MTTIKILLISLATLFLLMAFNTFAKNNSPDSVLDAMHRAAKEANAEAYYDSYTEDAIVFGTDATERFDMRELKIYTQPNFDSGEGWEFVVKSRNTDVDDSKTVAWFDEILHSKDFGQLRATGVLVKQKSGWKIKRYHLTLPIPNSIAGEVIEKIKASGG